MESSEGFSFWAADPGNSGDVLHFTSFVQDRWLTARTRSVPCTLAACAVAWGTSMGCPCKWRVLQSSALSFLLCGFSM